LRDRRCLCHPPKTLDHRGVLQGVEIRVIARKRQVESYDATCKVLGLFVPIAYCILLLRSLERIDSEAKATKLFSRIELEILANAPSNKELPPPRTMHEALLHIVRLGGHIRNNDPQVCRPWLGATKSSLRFDSDGRSRGLRNAINLEHLSGACEAKIRGRQGEQRAEGASETAGGSSNQTSSNHWVSGTTLTQG
jgi:hypothetical protein